MSSGKQRPVPVSILVSLALIALGATPGSADGHVTAGFLPDAPMPGAATISMQPGNSSGPAFDIEIRVTGIEDVFGAAFQVEFDPSLVNFVGFDGAGSFLAGDGAGTSLLAQQTAPGIVVCGATRLGQIAGVDAPGPPGSSLLMTLSFDAAAQTSGTGFQFGAPPTRLVTVCPTASDPCIDLPDGILTWAGGTLATEAAVPASSFWSMVFLVAALLGLSGLLLRNRAKDRTLQEPNYPVPRPREPGRPGE